MPGLEASGRGLPPGAEPGLRQQGPGWTGRGPAHADTNTDTDTNAYPNADAYPDSDSYAYAGNGAL